MELYLYRNGKEYGATTDKECAGEVYKTIDLTEKKIETILENWNLQEAFSLLN